MLYVYNMNPSPLVLDYIKRCIVYDPNTGAVSKDGKVFKGKNRGYAFCNLILDSKYQDCYLHYPVRAHQVAWYLYYDEWTLSEIDHIDQNRANNRIDNLRLATRSQNGANRGKTTKKTLSRYKGVSTHGSNYRAYIKCNQQRIHIGTFSSQELAAEAYNTKALELFGEFASLNVIE